MLDTKIDKPIAQIGNETIRKDDYLSTFTSYERSPIVRQMSQIVEKNKLIASTANRFYQTGKPTEEPLTLPRSLKFMDKTLDIILPTLFVLDAAIIVYSILKPITNQ